MTRPEMLKMVICEKCKEAKFTRKNIQVCLKLKRIGANLYLSSVNLRCETHSFQKYNSVLQTFNCFVIVLFINVPRIRGRSPKTTFLKVIKESRLGGTVVPEKREIVIQQ